MKNSRKGMFRSTKTSQQFLFYKTDEKPLDDEIDGRLNDPRESVSSLFPKILTGKTFTEYALALLDVSAYFGAMVIKTDEAHQSGDVLSSESLLNVAKTIDGICNTENGLWGQLGSHLFGCFFPDRNSDFCLEFARQIQEDLSTNGNQTVTIGIASFPTIEYKKDQILDNAAKALDHASFFGPNSLVVFDAVSLNISGDHAYQKGNITGAIAEFDVALQIDPKNVNVHNSLGVCYAVMGNFEKAIASFKAAMKLDPKEVMACYNTGLVYKLMGNNDKALEYFLKADEMGGELFEVAFQAGKIYFEIGIPETGKQFYQKAIDLAPQNGPNYRFIGECYAEIGLIDEAIAAYKKTVKANPNDANALSALGYLFDIKGENPEIALLFCKQSVDISPENGLFHHRLGNLYLKQNNLDEAKIQFKKAREMGFDASGGAKSSLLAPGSIK